MNKDELRECLEQCYDEKSGGRALPTGRSYTRGAASSGAVFLVANDQELRAWMEENNLPIEDGSCALVTLALASLSVRPGEQERV